MKFILKKYLDEEIGINIERPFKIESVKLIEVSDDYFSVLDHNQSHTHHFSYSSIVQIIENPNGVKLAGRYSHKGHFSVVVKVGHLYEYIPA